MNLLTTVAARTMVSLHHSAGISHGSGFFSEDPLQNQDEEILIHPEAISNEEELRFRPIGAVCFTAILVLLLIAVEILVFVLPAYCRNSQCVVQDFSALLYLQTAFWCLLVVLDQCLRIEHQRCKKAGYLHFCRKTSFLRRITLYVYSIGNALLLAVQVIIQDFCSEKRDCQVLKSVSYIQVVLSTENLISFPFVITYFVSIVRFYNKRPPPDVIQDDLLSSFSQIRVPSSEIGYRENSRVDVVIEKQADVIRYLKQHSTMLGKKLVQITAELNSHKAA